MKKLIIFVNILCLIHNPLFSAGKKHTKNRSKKTEVLKIKRKKKKSSRTSKTIKPKNIDHLASLIKKNNIKKDDKVKLNSTTLAKCLLARTLNTTTHALEGKIKKGLKKLNPTNLKQKEKEAIAWMQKRNGKYIKDEHEVSSGKNFVWEAIASAFENDFKELQKKCCR